MSDNAKTFKTTSKEVQKVLRCPKLDEFPKSKGIVLNSISEKSPWEGGIWERLVRFITESFHFRQVTVEDIFCQLGKLNPKKSSPVGSIPAKVMKENSDIFAPIIQGHFNANISQNDFPESLKAGDISSLYKKDDNFIKKHYRPITVLPSTSKI